MTEAQAIEAVLQRWIDAWPGLQPTVPYTFDNESFEGVASWARVSLVHRSREQVTMGGAGSRIFDARGSIVVELYGDVDAGRRPLATLADSVRSVLEARRIGDFLVTHAGATRELPTDGRWARSSVVVPFWYDETR